MITYRPLNKVLAITFDLDDTLYDNMPYIYEAEQSLLRFIKTNYPKAGALTQAQWRQLRLKAIAENNDLKHDLGSLRMITLQKGFAMVGIDKLLIPKAVQSCFDYFYFKRSDFKVNQSIHALLSTLARKVPLVAITNGNVNCSSIGIAPYFTHILQANAQYPMKPDKAMFNMASQLLKLPSKHILHVGDDLDKDVGGAIAAGFQSAWFAFNRPMHIQKETIKVLPHIQLSALEQLHALITD